MRQEFAKETEEGVFVQRKALARERLAGIYGEELVQSPFREYFQKTAAFVLQMYDLEERLQRGELLKASLKELQALNESLYEDIAGEAYDESYANPAFACKKMGLSWGRLLSMLCAELRSMIVYVYEGRQEEFLIFTELFLQVYGCFCQAEGEPSYREVQEAVYWFFSDYSELFMTRRVAEQVDESLSFAADIICGSDLNDLRYLYRFGEYVTDNELQTAAFLNRLPQKELCRIASTIAGGYRMGFVNGGKDLGKKKTVNIRYHLGFEPVIREVIREFQKMGLAPVIYRAGTGSLYSKAGYEGACPNRQYRYDHRADNGVYLDKRYVERRLGALKGAYEKYRDKAAVHGGPACVEVFGETPFTPCPREESIILTTKQKKLQTLLQSQAARITDQYIPGEERSFTIIAFPLPEIGEAYEEIFRETIRINTLDAGLYQKIQQRIIDELDQGVQVQIRGKGSNETDLTVALHPLLHPERETIFENCVADVNIPVGEVFTSPVLAGTNGTLFVSRVYLDGLLYKDLKLSFKEGMVSACSCANFPDPEKNREYILENVLHYHETLPMGEFAIGTNTAAYMMAKRYGIADRLPILIAEKMGPHFAVGDTCYSHEEDRPVYNPDGKEIVARENACSAMRREDPAGAYFNTHVDITIPYDELESIRVIRGDGTGTNIIENGRFVLPGTEELNAPFAEKP